MCVCDHMKLIKIHKDIKKTLKQQQQQQKYNTTTTNNNNNNNNNLSYLASSLDVIKCKKTLLV